jgi:TPR repeat protein
MYEEGLGSGVPKDQAKALMYWEKACELNQGEGCVEIVKHDNMACNAGEHAACLRKIERQEAECASGDLSDCAALGTLFSTEPACPTTLERRFNTGRPPVSQETDPGVSMPCEHTRPPAAGETLMAVTKLEPIRLV